MTPVSIRSSTVERLVVDMVGGPSRSACSDRCRLGLCSYAWRWQCHDKKQESVDIRQAKFRLLVLPAEVHLTLVSTPLYRNSTPAIWITSTTAD